MVTENISREDTEKEINKFTEFTSRYFSKSITTKKYHLELVYLDPH